MVEANAAYFKRQESLMREHGIIYSLMTMTVGNEFFLEPAFYWQDEITPLHRKSLGDDVVGPWLGPAGQRRGARSGDRAAQGHPAALPAAWAASTGRSAATTRCKR